MVSWIAVLLALCPQALWAYPLDGYADTGIRRVEAARRAITGEMRGRAQPPGGRLPTGEVDLRLLDHRDLELPAPDPGFSARVVALLGPRKDRYSIALLDLSDIGHPRYAEFRGDHRQNVGSVGKLIVALGLFQALADTYPAEPQARTRVLRDTVVTADRFIESDHHTVRLWDPDSTRLTRRPLRVGDRGSLWEFLDWMLSASSNAAASMVMQQAMLLRHFGRAYPIPRDQIGRFFEQTPAQGLAALFADTFHEPVTRNGLDLAQLRQGSFFTRYGKQRVPGTTSYGTARALALYTLRLEQGRLVDVYSSRQIKRLLYMTERRIRYASAPALADSAVYFKSGSLYQCRAEPGFVCRKYRGNVRNYMNSVAIVESPAGEKRLYYITALISDVLYKNSAVDHQTLATRIHRLIEAAHPAPPLRAGELPAEVRFGSRLIGFEKAYQRQRLIGSIQSALAALGYQVGGVDGRYGTRTRTAIRRFQRDAGLPMSGRPSRELLIRLNDALPERQPAAAGQSGRAGGRPSGSSTDHPLDPPPGPR